MLSTAFVVLGVAVVLVLSRAADGRSRPTGCGLDEGVMSSVLASVVDIASASESDAAMLRDRLSLPATTASAVVAVRSDSLCKVAGGVMNSDWEFPKDASRQVYLVKIASSRFWAEDPAIREGEWGVAFILDSSMTTVVKRAQR